MLKVSKVQRKGLGAQLGLEVGDEIIAFDGFSCVDELDYLYYSTLENFTLTVKDKRGEGCVTVEVNKEEGEDLGLEFEKNPTLRTCHNRCVFCFVDQMPKGMRDSLYVKDDDYTMSFTCGNFVTLTNVDDEALNRIIRLRLSPLYISVHTLDPDLRVKLLRNRHAGKIVEQIDRLAKNGIEMHCQAVIVPGENDGESLARTARKLFSYYPTVKDLACVPTGLTKFRDGLTKIPDVGKEYSQNLLDLVDKLNAEFGVNFLLPADEYFIKAERPLKPASFYGEFEQIENGIGLSAKFRSEFFEALDKKTSKGKGKTRLKTPKTSLLICGVSSAKLNADLVAKANETIEGLSLTCLPVVNRFFGETVTCTGLLTGEDMLAATLDYQKRTGQVFDEIILAGNTMKEFEDVFLCGMTLQQLKTELKKFNPKVCVRVNREGGYGLADILTTREK